MITMDDINTTQSLWAEEENFWLEGPDYFRAHMDRDAVMYFPEPTGMLRGTQILDALENAPRWDNVIFFNRSVETAADKVRLVYRAEASQIGGRSYVAQCESIYEKDAGDWKLTCHRQEPKKR